MDAAGHDFSQGVAEAMLRLLKTKAVSFDKKLKWIEVCVLATCWVCLLLIMFDLIFQIESLRRVAMDRYDSLVQLLAGISLAGTIFRSLTQNPMMREIEKLDELRQEETRIKNEIEAIAKKHALPIGFKEAVPSEQHLKSLVRLRGECEWFWEIRRKHESRNPFQGVADDFRMVIPYAQIRDALKNFEETDHIWFFSSGAYLMVLLTLSASVEELTVSIVYPICTCMIGFVPFARYAALRKIAKSISRSAPSSIIKTREAYNNDLKKFRRAMLAAILRYERGY